MNKLTIIGNLTRDPELRTTTTGLNVCTFSVAVNRRRSSQNTNQPETDFFRVTAWRQLGENCNKFLAKGRKVAVVGPVSLNTYEAKDGSGTRYTLEVTADDVEFLSPRQDDGGGFVSAASEEKPSSGSMDAGFSQVDDEDLPF